MTIREYDKKSWSIDLTLWGLFMPERESPISIFDLRPTLDQIHDHMDAAGVDGPWCLRKITGKGTVQPLTSWAY